MKMPFGKYKDVYMDEVPATYLDWLRGQSWIDQWPLESVKHPEGKIYYKENLRKIYPNFKNKGE